MGWILSWLGLGLYLLWPYFSDDLVVPLGISYFPDPYWAVALPSFGIVTVMTVVTVYIARNLIHTPSFDDFSTFTDDFVTIDTTQARVTLEPEGHIPPPADIPLAQLNKWQFRR